jgi:hypothetical protein
LGPPSYEYACCQKCRVRWEKLSARDVNRCVIFETTLEGVPYLYLGGTCGSMDHGTYVGRERKQAKTILSDRHRCMRRPQQLGSGVSLLMAALRFKCLSGEHIRPMRHRHSVAKRKMLLAQQTDGTHFYVHQVVSEAMQTFNETPLQRFGEGC